jgi:hypothetical protein
MIKPFAPGCIVPGMKIAAPNKMMLYYIYEMHHRMYCNTGCNCHRPAKVIVRYISHIYNVLINVL